MTHLNKDNQAEGSVLNLGVERSAFEAEYRMLLDLTPCPDNGGYMAYSTHWAWRAWKASAARAAPPALDAEGLPALRKIGAQMANVMFNLAQRPGDPLTGDVVAIMDSLRKQWDAAVRSESAARQDQQPARASVDTEEFRALLADFGHNWTNGDDAQRSSRAALIAHINAWGGVDPGVVPAPKKEGAL